MLQKVTTKPRTGGQILVDQLLIHGADTAYCVPGESYLEVLDALHDVKDRFTLINARHEAGAADMAEAHGKLTGKPGICMVTRGPGACHAAIGVHIAQQDSTPMILLVGQIARDTTDREAFQEVDYRAMFGPIAKWATQIDDARRVPEYIARAFRVATSGRPGPVVIALPEDMLTDEVDVADARPYAPTPAELSNDSLEALKAEITGAKKPLLLLGGSGWSDASAAAITRFAEANKIPVTCSFRRQDIVNNLSPVFAGDFGTSTAPTLYGHQRDADLLIVIGARLGEMTTKTYTTINSPNPQTRLVHLYPDADEIGRVYSPDLGIAAAPASVAAALDGVDLGKGDVWGDWCDRLHADYLTDSDAPNGGEWDLDMGVALSQIRDSLPDDTIVTLDAGNHTGWAQRFLRYGRPGRIIGSTCGSMGYAVPAAVAASVADPERLTLAFVGDGGFMMSGMELATAAQYGGCPIVLLFNNGIYGTIRMHQERDHPERVSGTTLINQDFVKLAEGLGAHAERVAKTADFAAAFERARASGRPALIELVTDPEQISTRTTIGKLRDAARAKANA
ncbi:thiamine pyrophosphate-dependent enzyme [Sulfitobacter geojensis]|uniref:Thiamine pyrophosphate-binding protein n=1 Tax=Sulfitobacter geojensis TaxID=1342299 RepID=A0AAE2W167_9RHOB|nr:thiamine pyrophosphate-dependent enzyme [Sulfitobacter geojensis]MBM1690772.1 thiamine pyrophosphate-binding protein [Sulfitobacter geojensis]MBM1694838.1 thiamine pyrophosphate-binding protein [Sulfitobacter geojensis]MBM1707008.1 thiamine pyrophosphate-binding protein [Sulfitobacter geojensis]MBM1711066.1 thiamine pyrophosphate-binding protein [Sulfitobacter geojensis]MBM1715132.1 thiamine pyrophosphate-binding protein [Sulfitobacter geojensis]